MTTKNEGAPAPKHAAVDGFTGEAVDPFLGAAAHPDDDLVIDPKARGDFVAEEPVIEPAVVAAKEPETPAEPAVEPAKEEDKPPHQELERDEKGRWIPKDRFDQINERRKTAEKELAELKSREKAVAQAAANAYDFDAAETRYMEAVLDGRPDDAKAIRREVREAERAMYQAEARVVAGEVYTGSRTKETVDSVIEDVVGRYEALDESSPTFDPEIADEIDAIYSGYLGKGQDAVSALKKAVNTVAKVNGWVDRKAAPPEPTPALAGAKPRQSVAEKLAAAERQPPSMAGVGVGSVAGGNSSLSDMSEEEYDALPESTRAKLRGDFFQPA